MLPGILHNKLNILFKKNNFFSMFNLFSGGALSKMTIFSLSIMPYISASIIIDLCKIFFPSIKKMSKDNIQGKNRINKLIKYLTILLSFIQSATIIKWLNSNHIIFKPNILLYFIYSITLITGTIFLVWLGEQITERGLGNGISLLIFFNMVSNIPLGIVKILFFSGKKHNIIFLISISVLILLFIYLIIFFELSQRKIPIHYSSRILGRKIIKQQRSYLPLKINISGIMPPIFANSFIFFISFIFSIINSIFHIKYFQYLSKKLCSGNIIYDILLFLLIIFFSFFYSSVAFNTKDTAKNLRKTGAFISGIRPGNQTSNYIKNIIKKITFIGSIYLGFITLLPELIIAIWNVPIYISGTSLLIVIIVTIDLINSIKSYILNYQYNLLMNKIKK